MCDDRNGLKWIVSPTKKFFITKMLFDEITMRKLFEMSQFLGNSWIVKCKEGQWEYKKIRFDKIDDEDLPEKKAYFDADYVEKLEYFMCMHEKSVIIDDDNINYRKEPIGISAIKLHNDFLIDRQKQLDLSKQYNNILLFKQNGSIRKSNIN